MIRLFYNPHAITWAEAGAEGEIHKAHESALAAGHYMLSGGFFEEYEKFHDFFDMLEDPKRFKQYKKLVIDRDRFSGDSCHSEWDDVFGQMIEWGERRKSSSMELDRATTTG